MIVARYLRIDLGLVYRDIVVKMVVRHDSLIPGRIEHEIAHYLGRTTDLALFVR